MNESPYCKICGACGISGCCSPTQCKQDSEGLYCSSYLKELRIAYDTLEKLYETDNKDFLKILSDTYDVIEKGYDRLDKFSREET